MYLGVFRRYEGGVDCLSCDVIVVLFVQETVFVGTERWLHSVQT